MYNTKYYGDNSRYLRNTDVTNLLSGVQLPLLFNKPVFKDSDIQSFFVVAEKHEGRIDLIADEVYSECALYWAIALANNITNLIESFDKDGNLIKSPKIGDVLKIPSLRSVRKYL